MLNEPPSEILLGLDLPRLKPAADDMWIGHPPTPRVRAPSSCQPDVTHTSCLQLKHRTFSLSTSPARPTSHSFLPPFPLLLTSLVEYLSLSPRTQHINTPRLASLKGRQLRPPHLSVFICVLSRQPCPPPSLSLALSSHAFRLSSDRLSTLCSTIRLSHRAPYIYLSSPSITSADSIAHRHCLNYTASRCVITHSLSASLTCTIVRP